MSFQKHFYTKASFFPHKEGIYLKSTLCSKPSADSITCGKAQALQPGIQGSLCHFCFPASPLHTLCSSRTAVCRMALLDILQSLLHFATSGSLPLWGGSSGTPALVRVLFRARAHLHLSQGREASWRQESMICGLRASSLLLM